MNNNLTINGVSFDLVASDLEAGSLRRDTSRGATLPQAMTIKHTTVNDSAQKRKVNRSLLKIERTVICPEGGVMPISAHIVVQFPSETVVANADIQACLDTLSSVIRKSTEGTGGLDLAGDVFIKRLQ